MRSPSEHIKLLQRRVDFLKSREHQNSYDLAEIGSLEWALANLSAEAEKQEPVAWIDDEGEFQWIKKIDNPEHTAFYTHPQPKREPLTDEQIAEFFGVKAVDESFVDFVRAIEAAHGIGIKQRETNETQA